MILYSDKMYAVCIEPLSYRQKTPGWLLQKRGSFGTTQLFLGLDQLRLTLVPSGLQQNLQQNLPLLFHLFCYPKHALFIMKSGNFFGDPQFRSHGPTFFHCCLELDMGTQCMLILSNLSNKKGSGLKKNHRTMSCSF